MVRSWHPATPRDGVLDPGGGAAAAVVEEGGADVGSCLAGFEGGGARGEGRRGDESGDGGEEHGDCGRTFVWWC
jgi:hypothetical protein